MAVAEDFIRHINLELEANRLLLPSLPAVVFKIREAVNDEKNGRYELAKLVQMDPALSARLVQIANSPAYRTGQTIDSVQIAIGHLGLGVTRDLVTCLVMHNVFRDVGEAHQAQIRTLWMHSCHVASISYVLAKINPGFHPDKALLGGLVHDIGMLPILYYASDFPGIASDTSQLQMVIKQLRGPLGSEILRRWRFADNLVDIPLHAEDWFRQGQDKADYADLVIVAQLHSYFGTSQQADLPALSELPAFNKLSIGKMGPQSSLELLLEAREEIELVRHMLSS